MAWRGETSDAEAESLLPKQTNASVTLDGVEKQQEAPPVASFKRELTRRIKVATLLVQISQGFLIVMPLVLMVYMVRDFFDGTGTSETRIGSLTGLAGGLLQAGHAVSGLSWGWVADRIGRRPVLLIGLVSTAVATLCLGLSVNYTMLCLSRFFGGLLNGTMGTIKTIVSEHTRESEHSRAFSFISGGFGFGSIVGSSIAGALSEPCGTKKQPEGFLSNTTFCAPKGIFNRFPYLLPCLAATIVTLTALVVANTTFHETLHTIQKRSRSSSSLSSSTTSQSNRSTSTVSLKNDNKHEVESSSDENDKQALDPDVEQPVVWYRDRNTLLALLGYVALAFNHLLFDETIPLYASADRSIGGLELNLRQLSIAYFTGGMSLILYVLNIYPMINNRLGSLRMTKIFSALFAIPALTAPSVYYAESTRAKAALLSLSYAQKTICGSSCFTPSMQLIAKVAPPDSLGTVNGFGTTGASIVRGIGPLLGGALWGLSTDFDTPHSQYFVFGLASIIAQLIPLLYSRMQL